MKKGKTTFISTRECPCCGIGTCSVSFDWQAGRADARTTKLYNTCGCAFTMDERVLIVGMAVAEFLNEYGNKERKRAA